MFAHIARFERLGNKPAGSLLQVFINMKNERKVRAMYKFTITEHHGAATGKFFVRNRQDPSLCLLDNHPASNTGLPIVFNTYEEADHYLSEVDEEERKDAVITETQIRFFNRGYALFMEDPNGVAPFGFDED